MKQPPIADDVGCATTCIRTFEDGVGLEDLLLDPRVLPADGRQELQDQLRALRLAGTRLATAAQ